MEREEDAVKKAQVVEARARNISHNVRCTECGSQSIEDSQADIAILLRKEQEASTLMLHSYSCVVFLHNLFPGQWIIILGPIDISLIFIPLAVRNKLIRDEIRSGKTDKEVYKKLEDDFGETVLYAPKFDLQTAALWLSPLLVAGAAGGIWAYNKHRQKTNVHIMALNLVRGVPLTPKEKETMLNLLTPPATRTNASSWWRKWLGHE
ncbi:cytochrome c-type biogenesis CcmH-like mitochondrial protein isoform X1 [Diospyros lotus]|uniref:cytochrome c-type biogenesis CcmH-like mitochondrial protein isoform X1 n=1 Tax=Diospyros lotus TaxID=55363 RepID=UPI002251002F|nr:cytochrome c-type biogenesis CcmH-like mitochondrial protein isoform X1 [Diospyros lotus]XP_052180989.1 cytochrome c-type biogenesis CcmH-like mitochondrial protein isoform X1 [Diospyros lotus]